MAKQDNSAPSLRVVEADELATALVVTRPHQPGDLLIVASGRITALQLMTLADLVLPIAERRRLADWLDLHPGLSTRPHDWPGDA